MSDAELRDLVPRSYLRRVEEEADSLNAAYRTERDAAVARAKRAEAANGLLRQRVEDILQDHRRLSEAYRTATKDAVASYERAERAEAALDAIEAMLTKKKRMGTLFDVQQIRGAVLASPTVADPVTTQDERRDG